MYARPWKEFVPPFKTKLNWPPEEWPNSGEYWFCRTVNSEMESFGTGTRGPVTLLLLLSMPSTVKLLLRGRCPPMLGPEPAPMPPLLATPELKRERLRIPLGPSVVLGRSAFILGSNVVASVEVVVSSASATPDTSTVVTAPLISRVIDKDFVMLSSIVNPLIVVVARFAADAEILYVPTAKLLNLYSPASLALVSYLAPVCVFTASTVAPGTTAPVLSRTVPVKLPLMS